ncbi:MAG TPA: hypothetical protein VI750_04145 [Pyrinomonadaceae bacterium]|nr:hypothetical protein [Pyrinomonadaceae bacterium]
MSKMSEQTKKDRRRGRIDRAFQQMSEDRAYQQEAELIAAQFEDSDWEALEIGERIERVA